MRAGDARARRRRSVPDHAARTHDVVIRDARLRRGVDAPLVCDVRDIGLTGDRITAISADPLDGVEVIEAGGAMILPSFSDAHLHLDKVHTWQRAPGARSRYAADNMAHAAEAIDLAAEVKHDYDEAAIATEARTVLLDGLANGITHVRAFADTDTRAGLRGVRPLLAVRDELRELIDVQVVAFPQDGVVRDPGAAAVVEEAVRLGADLVGGIPWIEDDDTDADRHIATMLDIAERNDLDVAMLTDDTASPDLRTTEMLVQAALDRGLVDRITVCHARALGAWPRQRLARLVRRAARAGTGFVTNPHTAPLALPVTALLDAGLPVALGQDDIADAYYPFGRHDLLEVAFLAAHALDMTAPRDLEHLLDMITVHPARIMRRERYGIAVGNRADLVVVDGDDAHDLLRRRSPPRAVLRGGDTIATTELHTEIRVPRPTAAAGHTTT